LRLRGPLRERNGAERAERLLAVDVADLLGHLEPHLVGVVQVGDDLDLGADVLARRGAEAAKRAETAERAECAAAGSPREAGEVAAADVGLERDVLTDVDLGGDVVGRQDVRRREYYRFVRRREVVDEDAERRDRDAGAEQVLAA